MVKRYDPTQVWDGEDRSIMYETKEGSYVSYEDYQALIQWMKDTVKELETRQDGWPVFLIEKKLKELGEWNEKV